MTLLALFDGRQKNLRSQLRNQPNPERSAKNLQDCFDAMYHEYVVAHSLDQRGQRELAFVIDMLKQSTNLLVASTVSSTKVNSGQDNSGRDNSGRDNFDGAGLELEPSNQVIKTIKTTWSEISSIFGGIQPWSVVKTILGFFLFAMLWFQSQFFAAFIVLVLGLGDLFLRLLGLSSPKKKTLQHTIITDSAKLLAAVAELVKCADKLVIEKKGALILTNSEDSMPNRLPITLFQDLIEARYANDGDLALKRIRKLPTSLEEMGIQAVDYDGYNADYFDILPKIDSDDGGYETAVPALIKGDQVLARGRVYK